MHALRTCGWRLALASLLAWLPLACLAQQPAPVPPFDSPVVDTTGTLDPATTRQLQQQALDLQQRKGSQLQVLVIPSTAPETTARSGSRSATAWRVRSRTSPPVA